MARSARMTASRSAGSKVDSARWVSLSVSAAITCSTLDAVASILPQVHELGPA